MAGALGLLSGWVETLISFRKILFLKTWLLEGPGPSPESSLARTGAAKARGHRPELPCPESSLINCSLQTEVTRIPLEPPTPDGGESAED